MSHVWYYRVGMRPVVALDKTGRGLISATAYAMNWQTGAWEVGERYHEAIWLGSRWDNDMDDAEPLSETEFWEWVKKLRTERGLVTSLARDLPFQSSGLSAT